MKKLILAAAALFAACAFTVRAQESFEPGLYLQLQGGAAYNLGEASFFKLIDPAAQVAVGYRFNEVFGARISANGWLARNYTSGTENLYKYKFVQPSLDFQFDLASLFGGWEAGRVFNPYWFLGGGVPIGLDNQDAIDLHKNGDKFSLLWEPTKIFWAARTGLGADIRINDWLAFNLELNANMYPDTFNSKQAVDVAPGPDWRFNALAGFTIRFGKSRKPVPAVLPAAPVDNRKPAAREPKKEVAPEKPAPQDEKATVFYQGADVDVFFDLNKAVIRNDQIPMLNQLVAYLRNTPDAKLKLDGYADRATGTADINQELSEQRVIAVRQYLVSRGIEATRIATSAHGDKVQPFTGEKNRVVTCRIR